MCASPKGCYTSPVNLERRSHFCSDCGHPVVRRVPPGDGRERDCCDACGAIHYVNPRLIVGTIPVQGTRILLCRRAIEPRLGFWTLPAGFMETGESAADGARRETLEEANARIEMGPLFSMIDVLAVDQVHVFYRARLLDSDFGPGAESLDVRLFEPHEIPWDELAFRTVSTTLKLYLEDAVHGNFGVHTRELRPVSPRPA